MAKNCIVASAVVFNKRGKILLIKHKKFDTWIYPGGHVEDNEHPDKSVVREVFEETGIKIKIIDALKGAHISDKHAKRIAQPTAIMLENAKYKTGLHRHFDLIYLAEPVGESARPNKESHDVGWFNRQEINKLDIKFKNVTDIINVTVAAYKRLKKS